MPLLQILATEFCGAGTVQFTDGVLEWPSRRSKNLSEIIVVVVVVSGEEVQVSVNTHQQVTQLVREALNESGNKGQDPSKWVLKTATGNPIPQNETIAAAGITNGEKLFLNPETGSGG